MDWLMNINFWGVVHAPAPSCRICRRSPRRISSTSPRSSASSRRPDRPPIAAAKFAVRGFSESLRHELQVANSPVRLSVVHPGGVATNIARNSRTGSLITDNARRAECDRTFRQGGEDDAGGRGAAHHQGHREERAAHPDRQRRALHGPPAAIPSRRPIGRRSRARSRRGRTRRGDERACGASVTARVARRNHAPSFSLQHEDRTSRDDAARRWARRIRVFAHPTNDHHRPTS